MPSRCKVRRLLASSLPFVLLVAGASAHAEPRLGHVHVMSNPLGEVLVDGRPTGVRTPARALELEPGEHQVTVRFPESGRTAEPRRVTVRSGATAFAYFRDRARGVELDATCADGDETSCIDRAMRELERGDLAAAEPELEAYLRLFPDGAYAEAARSMLATLAHERAHPVEDGRRPLHALVAFGGFLLLASMAWLFRARRRAAKRSG
jgi:hypothetical protein